MDDLETLICDTYDVYLETGMIPVNLDPDVLRGTQLLRAVDALGECNRLPANTPADVADEARQLHKVTLLLRWLRESNPRTL